MRCSAVRRVAALAVTAAALSACGSTVDVGTAAPTTARADGLAIPPELIGQDPLSVPTPGTAGSSTSASTSGADDAPRGPGTVSSGSSTTTTGPSAGGRGAARVDRRPVKIGILYANNDAAAGAGVDNGNSYSPRNVFEALVSAWNSRGGVAARKVEPVYAEIKSSSASFEGDLAAACATFVQDAKVALVISTLGLFSESFTSCIADADTPMITGDYSMGDDVALSRASSTFAASTFSLDDRMQVLLERTVAAGRLTKDARLGVVVEGCPFNERAHTGTVVPVAKRLGTPVVDTVTSRCFQSINDLGGLAADMQSAVLRFQTDGITHVTLVSGGAEGNLLLFLAAAAEAQGYHPTYLVTSVAAPTVQEANTPRGQLANVVGLGWLPTIDTTRAQPATAAQSECLADLQKGGLTPSSGTDRYFGFSTCDTFALADRALRTSRGATDLPTLSAAIHSLGSGFRAAATYAGATSFSGSRRGGPSTGRLFAWSTGCGCFDYTGSPFTLLT